MMSHRATSHLPPLCAVLVILALTLSARSQEQADRDHPLVVDEHSRVALMEYEAWFGPNGVTFQNSSAMPWLQSPDMIPFGGGYDSADPAVIRRHVEWLEWLGMDGAIVDLTNDVACIFDSEWFVRKYLSGPGNCQVLRKDFQSIRDNTGNLYPAWFALRTRLKIVPLLGGIDDTVLYPDEDGKTALEKEIDYFGDRMEKYPERNVIYEGKPLMIIFLGAAQDPDTADRPLWFRIRKFLAAHPEITSKYTFRLMAGYLGSQSYLWTNPHPADEPREIASEYGFWSWVDRLKAFCTNALCPYYPTYVQHGNRVENFTASIATAGQDGWACPDAETKPYCSGDALRWNDEKKYATFTSFMEYARRLDPVFLILHQFNEFQSPDEGFDANTNDDIEPANLWGASAFDPVREQIRLYHCHAEW